MPLEGIAGGWAPLYGVYKAMEESGKLRRGHFVEGLRGAQFAYAGAVDRLRQAREAVCARPPTESDARVLAATDPALPYGALVPWPETRCPALAPRRSAGASVILVSGEPVLFLDPGGRRILSFPTSDDLDGAGALATGPPGPSPGSAETAGDARCRSRRSTASPLAAPD